MTPLACSHRTSVPRMKRLNTEQSPLQFTYEGVISLRIWGRKTQLPYTLLTFSKFCTHTEIQLHPDAEGVFWLSRALQSDTYFIDEKHPILEEHRICWEEIT